MEDKRRMYIQEIAILSLVRRGEAVKKVSRIGKVVYKLKCENPWVKTVKEQPTKLPQIQLRGSYE